MLRGPSTQTVHLKFVVWASPHTVLLHSRALGKALEMHSCAPVTLSIAAVELF